MTEIELPVRGMTCRACEVRVGKALRAVPGVHRARVSSAHGRVRVTTTGRVPRRALAAAVTSAGYEVGDEERAWLSRDRRVWTDVGLAVTAVVVLAVIAETAGWAQVLGRAGGAVQSGSLLLVAGLGVAAGLSTCTALVGGLVLGTAARYAQRHPDASRAQRLRPHLAFGVGRLAGFALGGAALGLLGSSVRLSAGAVALVTMVASAAMIALGLQLTAVSPRLARLTPALPARLATVLRLDGGDGGDGTDGPGTPAPGYRDGRAGVLGAATFLLPCGVTQVVQLYAMSTGDAVQATLVMTAFAVGTAPGLLGLAGLAAVVRGAFAPRFLRVAGVAVLAFAVVNVSGALTVLAPGLGDAPGLQVAAEGDPNGALPAELSADLVPVEDGVQLLRTVQDVAGYSPARATVVAGVPVRWEVDSVAPGCASALHAPQMGLGTVLLGPGVTVLEFTPTEPGRLHYSCAMGMYTGVVDVVEAPAA